MRKFIFIISLFSLIQSIPLNGQTLHGQGKKKLATLLSSCEVQLDTLTIAPTSVSILFKKDTISDGFLLRNTEIQFNDSLCQKLLGQNIEFVFRTLPFNIEEVYFHLDSTMMKTEDRAIYIGSDYNFAPKGQKIIDAKGLDYNGSFSRGFSVGNSQSLVLNSNFNLQLTGDLGNGINVVAAISDDNIPIQPQGNTQLIQEFDKVYIKVSKDNTSVIAGDYTLERPMSYFINYNKKLKGLTVSNKHEFGESQSLTTKGSFAISRGKFARLTLNTKEGNQGPYKLTGNEGERFIIILSGLEKVYLDGQILKRGLEYDYIIDYNRAEITFTPSRLIGRESRIIIEYEYSVQNYLRSVYAADAHYSTPKYDLNFSFYNEQDSKNATGDLVLDSTDILILGQIGDSLMNARIPSIRLANDSTLFSGQIRYRLNPNVIGLDSDTVYLEYSTNTSEDLYVASFLEVGEAQGRYIISDSSIVNGRVYRYVGPGNGLYEPISVLIPPEKKQIISFGAQIRPGHGATIRSELSLSNNDLNRYSSAGNDNNLGLAGLLAYNQKIKLGSSSKWSFITDNKIELVDQNFTPLNPYRSAEFNRDWNLNGQLVSGQQNILKTTVELNRLDSLRLAYSYFLFDIKDSYHGTNHSLDFKFISKSFQLISKIDFLNSVSELQEEKTSFRRPRIEISQLISKKRSLKLGISYEGEKNERLNLSGNENLLQSSFSFDLYKIYLENSPQNRLHYKLIFSNRSDHFPDADKLIKSINTNEISTETRWEISSKQNLSFNFGWRNFKVLENELTPNNQSSKKTIIGKLEHNLQAWQGFLISNTSYLINSGQEPKIEYFFEKVEAGQGDYIYVGNQDSVLINANFRYAPNLGTGNFIRLSLINNEFITTNNQNLSQSLRFEPKRLLAKSNSNFFKFLSRFSTISTFRISKKIEEDQNSSNNFLNFSPSDSNIVSYNSLISNTLFFNRGNPLYDIQVGNRVTSNTFTQISGLEERDLNEYFTRTRIKLINTTDLILNLKMGNRTYQSVLFQSRNLDIENYSINPEISYRPNAAIRINALYTFDQRNQRINSKENALSHDFTLSTTWRQASSANLNISISFVNVTFNGLDNSTIEFDLLDGLKNGKNYLWNTVYSKRLSNSIDLNISYEGRKTGTAAIVHIARAQVKATF